MKTIESTLTYLSDQIGVNLKPCGHFSGMLKTQDGRQYFNITTEKPVFLSPEYSKLTKFQAQYGTISVEPNGNKRISIFF